MTLSLSEMIRLFKSKETFLLEIDSYSLQIVWTIFSQSMVTPSWKISLEPFILMVFVSAV